ncbi:hypothetical protein ES705_31505 [subsurface metagenome]
MKKKILVVALLSVLFMLVGGVALAQTTDAPDTSQWIGFLSNILAALVIIVPSLSVILIKIAKVMKKSAEVTEEYQQVQLVVSEALADGNVDNDELAKIVSKGQSAGVASKELYEMIKDMIAEAHAKFRASLPKKE